MWGKIREGLFELEMVWEAETNPESEETMLDEKTLCFVNEKHRNAFADFLLNVMIEATRQKEMGIAAMSPTCQLVHELRVLHSKAIKKLSEMMYATMTGGYFTYGDFTFLTFYAYDLNLRMLECVHCIYEGKEMSVSEASTLELNK